MRAGYFFTYYNTRITEERKAQIERINEQVLSKRFVQRPKPLLAFPNDAAARHVKDIISVFHACWWERYSQAQNVEAPQGVATFCFMRCHCELSRLQSVLMVVSAPAGAEPLRAAAGMRVSIQISL